MPVTQPSDCPFYLISRITLQVTSAMKKGLTDAGVASVKPAYLGVLLCLWQEDGSKVVDLSRCARLEPSTMTGLLDRMERDKLIYRSPDPNDRRAYRICLTDEGKSMQKPAMDVTQKVLEKIFTGISDADINHTMAVLQKVLANIGGES